MSVELLGGRERKWFAVLGKEKVCVECWNHCKWSKIQTRKTCYIVRNLKKKNNFSLLFTS